MKVITKYQCEICLRIYEDQEQARMCESRGKLDRSRYPIGLMYQYNHDGYCGIFAIAGLHEGEHMHSTAISSWACRGGNYARYGDTLGEDKCGGNASTTEDWLKWSIIEPQYIDSPEFIRMVEFLKSKGITPRYYNQQFKLMNYENSPKNT